MRIGVAFVVLALASSPLGAIAASGPVARFVSPSAVLTNRDAGATSFTPPHLVDRAREPSSSESTESSQSSSQSSSKKESSDSKGDDESSSQYHSESSSSSQHSESSSPSHSSDSGDQSPSKTYGASSSRREQTSQADSSQRHSETSSQRSTEEESTTHQRTSTADQSTYSRESESTKEATSTRDDSYSTARKDASRTRSSPSSTVTAAPESTTSSSGRHGGQSSDHGGDDADSSTSSSSGKGGGGILGGLGGGVGGALGGVGSVVGGPVGSILGGAGGAVSDAGHDLDSAVSGVFRPSTASSTATFSHDYDGGHGHHDSTVTSAPGSQQTGGYGNGGQGNGYGNGGQGNGYGNGGHGHDGGDGGDSGDGSSSGSSSSSGHHGNDGILGGLGDGVGGVVSGLGGVVGGPVSAVGGGVGGVASDAGHDLGSGLGWHSSTSSSYDPSSTGSSGNSHNQGNGYGYGNGSDNGQGDGDDHGHNGGGGIWGGLTSILGGGGGNGDYSSSYSATPISTQNSDNGGGGGIFGGVTSILGGATSVAGGFTSPFGGGNNQPSSTATYSQSSDNYTPSYSAPSAPTSQPIYSYQYSETEDRQPSSIVFSQATQTEQRPTTTFDSALSSSDSTPTPTSTDKPYWYAPTSALYVPGLGAPNATSSSTSASDAASSTASSPSSTASADAESWPSAILPGMDSPAQPPGTETVSVLFKPAMKWTWMIKNPDTTAQILAFMPELFAQATGGQPSDTTLIRLESWSEPASSSRRRRDSPDAGTTKDADARTLFVAYYPSRLVPKLQAAIADTSSPFYTSSVATNPAAKELAAAVDSKWDILSKVPGADTSSGTSSGQGSDSSAPKDSGKGNASQNNGGKNNTLRNVLVSIAAALVACIIGLLVYRFYRSKRKARAALIRHASQSRSRHHRSQDGGLRETWAPSFDEQRTAMHGQYGEQGLTETWAFHDDEEEGSEGPHRVTRPEMTQRSRSYSDSPYQDVLVSRSGSGSGFGDPFVDAYGISTNRASRETERNAQRHQRQQSYASRSGSGSGSGSHSGNGSRSPSSPTGSGSDGSRNSVRSNETTMTEAERIRQEYFARGGEDVEGSPFTSSADDYAGSSYGHGSAAPAMQQVGGSSLSSHQRLYHATAPQGQQQQQQPRWARRSSSRDSFRSKRISQPEMVGNSLFLE